jgi:phosphoserine phosphatase RsbU/P
VRADLRDSIYFVGFLLAAGVLLILGRDQLPSAGLFTWGLTFGATTAAGILLVSLYRVQLELKQSRHELARKQAEMNFAREVQAALFPRDLPVDRGLSFSAICIPAQGISGDYYDILECPDGRIVVALADISGKGISAAILMANLQARFRALIENISSLGQVCGRLNTHLHNFTDAGRFATLFVAQWCPGSGLLEYVNAGHQIPVLLGSGIRDLEKGGPPLGLFGDLEYEVGKVEIRGGDLMVVYSDGITEARDERDQEFGDGRLRDLVAAHRSRPLRDIQKIILEGVGDWSRREPEDDMTLVLVRVEDESRLRETESAGEAARLEAGRDSPESNDRRRRPGGAKG